MKNIFILIIISISTVTFGQSYQNESIKYRVVAISSESPEIQSISNTVELYLPLSLHMPSAFSPNGDGLNDSFGIVGEGIESYRLTIFNRWGETLFETNQVNNKWNGKHKGELVPFGSYNYELVASGKEFGEIKKAGRVTVVN